MCPNSDISNNHSTALLFLTDTDKHVHAQRWHLYFLQDKLGHVNSKDYKGSTMYCKARSAHLAK